MMLNSRPTGWQALISFLTTLDNIGNFQAFGKIAINSQLILFKIPGKINESLTINCLIAIRANFSGLT